MKQKIGTVKGPTDKITDLDVAFVAFYNLLYEKIESEPKKGIVVSKGNPNQRKETWKNIMLIAHMIEDFFILRKQRTGNDCCEECEYWKPISVTSPHIGMCTRYNRDYIHKMSSCKNGFKSKGEQS